MYAAIKIKKIKNNNKQKKKEEMEKNEKMTMKTQWLIFLNKWIETKQKQQNEVSSANQEIGKKVAFDSFVSLIFKT